MDTCFRVVWFEHRSSVRWVGTAWLCPLVCPKQTRSAPLVAAFGEWLQAQRRNISAKSRVGEKLIYIHNHWDGLQTFLTDGRVEIDNNRVENLIRTITLNRKNALFAGHDEGGIA